MAKQRRSRRKRRSAKKSPASACELIKTYRPALLVYAALWELAAGKRQYQGTRQTIRDKIGVNIKTISNAMRVLAEAGWIKLGYGSRPDQARKWYRVTFVSDEFLPGTSSPTAPKPPCRKTPTSKRRPKTRQTGRSEEAAKPASPPSTAVLPGTHAAGPREGQPARSAERNVRHETNPPAYRQTGQRDASLDPSNGSKGSVPLDPPGGSYSLERVGGAPPSPRPPLRCGGAEGTPLQAQGLVEGVDQLVYLPDRSAARNTVAGVGGSADGRQTADTIDEIIATIGSESPGDPEGPSAPTDGRMVANTGEGGD